MPAPITPREEREAEKARAAAPEDIGTLLRKQTEEIHALAADIHRIKRRMFWVAVGSYVRLALILIPLIVAAIFLPPLLKDALRQYESVMEMTKGAQGGFSGMSSELIREWLEQMQ